ncbi:MAG: hypothetical protein PHE24_01215 [Patescibacteria group bacterium]|nr:hypothetical protein [Patescibacteria group bacterium]
MKDDEKLKQLAIEQLNKTPIVQVVCEKIGLPRTTFYRWKENDEKFAEAVNKAICDGRHLINDFAESQLLTAIKNNNLTAIIYWLNHNHKNYANKLEIDGRVKTDNGRLTPEQEESIKQALKLASLFENNNLLTSQEEKPASS